MTTNLPPASSATPAMRSAIRAGTDAPVVFDWVTAQGPDGIKFDAWYCNDHLPALAEQTRGRGLRRYAAPSRSTYVAIGELESTPHLAGGNAAGDGLPSTVSRRGRFVGEPRGLQRRCDVGSEVIDCAVVYPAFLRVPDDRMEEVDRWYDEEHLPMLLSCPQWVMTRRFRILGEGLDWNHVALHYLIDLRALRSPERDLARGTPWRRKILAEGWFAPEYWICYRLWDF